MDQGTLYALLRAVGFKTSGLTIRLLQEKGASEFDTYAIYRFALIPSFLWSLIFVRKEDIVFILNSPRLIIIFSLIIILFNLWAIIKSFVINTTNSMVFYTTLHTALTLPFFLIFGSFFNGDTPNAFSLSAIAVLLVAIFLKPTPHKKNSRSQLSRPFLIIALLILLNAVCSTVLDGISREALKEIHPTVFLGVYSFTTLLVLTIVSKFVVRRRVKESSSIKRHKLLALMVPMIWFAASIPEAFALAALPIYTVVSLGSITFFMDTFSDVIHRRIRFNFQTISFVILVLIGISLSALSV